MGNEGQGTVEGGGQKMMASLAGENNAGGQSPFLPQITSMMTGQKSTGLKLPIDALNSLLNISIQKLSNYINVQEIEEANKNLNGEKIKDFERGKNFEGVMNDSQKLNGPCRIYSSDDQIYMENQTQVRKKIFTVFFGNFVDTQKKGAGIQAKSYITEEQFREMKEQNKIILNLKEVQILKLDHWETNDIQKGVYLSLVQKEVILFQGDFKDRHFHQGQLEVFNEEKPIIKYKGKFNIRNQLRDQNGYLEYVGKTKYRGGFDKNQRSGFGVQEDEQKKTIYIGKFERNKKNGYGELTYTNRENVKLKAFWNNDMVQKDEGVFVTANGQKLQLMGDNTYI